MSNETSINPGEWRRHHTDYTRDVLVPGVGPDEVQEARLAVTEYVEYVTGEPTLWYAGCVRIRFRSQVFLCEINARGDTLDAIRADIDRIWVGVCAGTRKLTYVPGGGLPHEQVVLSEFVAAGRHLDPDKLEVKP